MISGISLAAESMGRRKWLALVAGLHLLFVLVVFSPVWLKGCVLLGSTDNYFCVYPNLLNSYDFFRRGELGLWNQYIFCGLDFSASTHNYIMSPPLWPLFLLPKAWFLTGLSVKALVELWLIGVFGYLFLFEELGSRRWAFLSSLVYQLSGYMFLNITMFPNLTAALFFTVSLWLVWSMGRRRALVSYIALTVCVALVLYCTNIILSFAFLFALFVLYLYRQWPLSVSPVSKPFWVTGTAVLTALLLAAPRLLPIALSIPDGDRMPPNDSFYSCSTNHHNNLYAGLTAFVPEVMGANMNSSRPILDSITWPHGRNSQGSCMNYFGTLPLLLILCAVFLRRASGLVCWSLMLAAAVAWYVKIPPLGDFPALLFYPFQHDYLPRTLIFAPLAVLCGHGGMRLESFADRLSFRRYAGPLVCLALAFCGLLVMRLYCKIGFLSDIKIIFCAAGALALFGFAARGRAARLIFAGLGCALGAWGFWELSGGRAFFGSFRGWMQNALFVSTLSCLLGCLVFSAALFAALVFLSRKSRFTEGRFLLLALPLLLAAFALFAWPFKPMSADLPGKTLGFFLALGMLRLALLSAVFFCVLAFCRAGRLPAGSLALIFLFFSLPDLMSHFKIYQHIITEPFYDGNPYPPPLREKLCPVSGAGAARESLLMNGSFEDTGADAFPAMWDPGLVRPGTAVEKKDTAAGAAALRLSNKSAGQAVLQQTVSGDKFEGGVYSFGLWVKCPVPGKICVFLTDEKQGVAPFFNSGSPHWEWLSVAHSVKNPTAWIRPHILLEPGAEALADGAALVAGGPAVPRWGADSETFRPAGFKEDPRRTREDMDIVNYRVNFPLSTLGLSAWGEPQATIHAAADIRGYCGVNSLRPARHTALANMFAPPEGVMGLGAMSGGMTDQRYLALTGCRYDRGKTIPDAFSRFMLFSDYAVERDDKKTLDTLKDPKFDIMSKVILTEAPGFAPEKGRAVEKVPFREFKSSKIELSLDTGRPALLFFNDSFHPGWKAFVNGNAAPVTRANFGFMAVPVPAGKSAVVLEFRPPAFCLGVKIAAAGLALLVVMSAVFWAADRFRRLRPSAAG